MTIRTLNQKVTFVTPAIGYYIPDPGHRSPNIRLGQLGDKALVYETRTELIHLIDNDEWAPIENLKQRILEVNSGPRHNGGGPMEDIRTILISGYVDVLIEGIKIAPHVESIAKRLLLDTHSIRDVISRNC